MRREADAGRLLHSLLDRLERQPDRTRRVTAWPAQAFANGQERDALTQGLAAAAEAGAVAIEMDRDAPHLVARVILADPARLYDHLGRAPAVQRVDAGLQTLRASEPSTELGRGLVEAFEEHWRRGVAYVGIPGTDPDAACALVRVTDAAFTPLSGAPLPLRTRSARLLGDSKAMERGLSRLLTHLRLVGLLDPALAREEALAALGLSKFPQPVLLAGPVTLGGVDASQLTCIGVAPEDIGELGVSTSVQAVLSVENLESFHRHAREARGVGDIVIYCGGFPSHGVVQAMRRLLDLAGLNHVFHWGDIDAGGVRIGGFLEDALGVLVVPHLMDEHVAREHGRAVPAIAGLSLSDRSAFGALARFLGSADAHVVEQEAIDPVPLRRTPTPPSHVPTRDDAAARAVV